MLNVCVCVCLDLCMCIYICVLLFAHHLLAEICPSLQRPVNAPSSLLIQTWFYHWTLQEPDISTNCQNLCNRNARTSHDSLIQTELCSPEEMSPIMCPNFVHHKSYPHINLGLKKKQPKLNYTITWPGLQWKDELKQAWWKAESL